MFSVSYELTTTNGSGMSETQPVLPGELADKVGRWFDIQHREFVKGSLLVFRRTLFEGLIYLLRRCPVVTGRLRGSFSTYFQRHNQAARVAKVADVPGMGQTSKGKFDQAAFDSGMNTQGIVSEEPFDVTIGSNVEYGPGVELNHGFLAATLVFLAERFPKYMEAWMKVAEQKGYIPAYDESEEETGY